ncbi:hypothetical protein CTT30_23315 (plasmid) [Vibrio coralliilyticus]|nr:hypothetical protein CTT30_23315 [Vibrio coralliilyticus]
MRAISIKKKNAGMTLVEFALVSVLISIAAVAWQERILENQKIQSYETQAKRLGEIANSVVRYISSAGDPASGLLAPHEQSNVAGQPFNNGTVHVGLNWLKANSCTGGSAPSEYLPCEYSERPIVGDNQQYRFTVSNDGTNLSVNFQYVDSNDVTRGVVVLGQTSTETAVAISTRAEGQVTFSSAGATNSFFNVDRNSAIISIQIGLNIANTPYQRTDGRTPITGTEHFANNAGIIFDTPGDIEGAQTISAERFSAYDRASTTVSTTRYIEPSGTSEIESLNAANTVSTQALIAQDAYLDRIQTSYIEQLDPTIQSLISGELKIGDNTNHTTIGGGNIATTGNIYDANDPNFLIDLDGTSRFQDIAIGALNEALLSERLPNFVQKGAVVIVANDSVPKPECGANGDGRMIMVPLKWTTYFLDSGNITINNNLNEFYADDAGITWTARMKTYRPSDRAYIDDPNASALANIYCYFP